MLNLDHVVIPVWRPDESLVFYGETLGLPLSAAITGEDWGGRPWLMMIFALAEGRELVLVSLRGAQPPAPHDLPADTRHYAFSVAGRAEREDWRERLVAAGIQVSEEDHGDQQSIYFADPNGVVLEITTPASAAQPSADPLALDRARRWIAESLALTG